MVSRRRRRQLTIEKHIAPDPMPPEELRKAERLLASLVAKAYLAAHADLLTPRTNQVSQEEREDDAG